jgi:hypothetical protein
MTKEDLELIKSYQAWRRDDNNDPLTRLPMPNPTEIGIALDKIIDYFELKFKKNDTKTHETL